MKKIVLLLTFFLLTLHAEVINQFADTKLIQSQIPIVDIRTPGEWKETGLLMGSIPIMFFDERGKYDIRGFLKALNSKIDTSKPFAIICHTGSRTSMLAPFLSQELGYHVINLKGGVAYAQQKKLPFIPYPKK